MVTKQLLAALALSVSVSASAADFSDADAKFALRDTSAAAAQAARDAYKAILDQGAKDSDLIRAAEGYLRAQFYEGTHYYSIKPESTVKKDIDEGKAVPVGTGAATRKKVFNAAWNSADILSPTALGFESPAYYYFRAAGVAYEAEVSGPIERLTLLLPKLNDAMEKGLKTAGGETYEGGGILRVKAAVKGNPEAKAIPGVYNPEESLKLIDQALVSEAYPGNVEGALYCENFRRKVITQNELKDKAGATATADQALADFPGLLADGLIPEFLRAETEDCIKSVTELKATL